MLPKPIIACLDVTGGRVVKGVNFVNLRDAGDPVELADRYNQQGADEVVFLDITASSNEREIMAGVVARTARKVFIPLAVGGGIRSIGDARRILLSRRDKGRVNTPAAPGAPPPTPPPPPAAFSSPAPTRSASTPPPCAAPSSSPSSATNSARR